MWTDTCELKRVQKNNNHNNHNLRSNFDSRLEKVSDRWFARVFHKWTSLADGQWLYAEPRRGDDSDGCVRCYGTNGRPSRWSWLQPFTTAVVGGSGRTKAYGHRRQPARVHRISSDDGRPAGGERPAALLEPRPQERDDPVVPQLGHELVDVPNVVSLP